MTPFIRHKLSIALAIALATLSSATSRADGPQTNESKENPAMESQGTGNITDIIKWLNEAEFLNDGTLGIGYTRRDSDNNLDFRIETRLFGIWDTNSWNGRREDPHPFVQLFPVEIRIRTKLNQGSATELAQARTGAVRFLLNQKGGLGVTLQLLSWVQRQHTPTQAQVNGVEAVSLALNSAVQLTEDGVFELVIKGQGSIGGAYLVQTGSETVRQQLALDAPVRDNNGAWMIEGGGSLGLRIAKKVLVDLFAGVDTLPSGHGNDVSHLDTVNYSYGASLRYMPTDWFAIIAGIKKQRAGVYGYRLHKEENQSPQSWVANERQDDLSGYITLEVHY